MGYALNSPDTDRSGTLDQMSGVEELRGAIEARIEDGQLQAHPADRDRLNDDRWLAKFLEHNDGDQKIAAAMLAETIQWRRTAAVNEIDESTINMEYIADGLFYPRGKDVDGCTMLVFKTKKNSKGQRDMEDLKKCVLYWMDRLDRLDREDRISVFFDMEGTGLSNMDMDFTRFLIGLFKSYYPDFLNYILIYEMPWVLNAAFKIIKTLLPAKAVAKMKFINRATLTQFVPIEQAHTSWGGRDDYVYSFVPSSRTSPADVKRVTFADPGTPSDENAPDERMMKLSPWDVIAFRRENDDVVGGFTITNSHDGPIAYKIKTTAPEKTKVWPNVGTLTPGKTEPIKIILTSPGQSMSAAAAKIKFLVVCTPITADSLTAQELADIWKNMSKLKLEQQRLQCTAPSLDLAKKKYAYDGDRETATLQQSISNLETSHAALNAQLKSLKTIQLVNLTLTTLLICLIIYFFRNANPLTDGYREFCRGP